MKKILSVLLISLLFTLPAMAASVETGQVAELYEQAYGRWVSPNSCELITIWYEGDEPDPRFGVSSGTVAMTSFYRSSVELVFYEAGQPLASTSTRFASNDTIDLSNKGNTSDTVEALVEVINSDTSDYFKAAIGRDATPGTSTAWITPADVNALLRTEDDAIDDGDVLTEYTGYSETLRAGFVADAQTTNRLQYIEETVAGRGVHKISVWDGEDEVWRREYGSIDEYSGTGIPGGAGHVAGVTPLTIDFTSHHGKGLSAHKGKNLTVTSEWTTDLLEDAAKANLSIVVGTWKE